MRAHGQMLALGGLALSLSCAFGRDARPWAEIFPSGPAVPTNLLRIELRFSAPLRIPFTMEHVRLIGHDGREIHDAFLDLPLPSADGRRVTILMNPARVKTGVAENLVLGRALRVGSTVTLLVNDPQLAGPLRKSWRVTSFDATPPRPSRWRLDLPARGTREALVIHLLEPLTSTAGRFIAIRGPDGARVQGSGHLGAQETIWRFIPAKPWHQGAYAIVVNPQLEDPAGNRPCGPFESLVNRHLHCDDSVRGFAAIGTKEKS